MATEAKFYFLNFIFESQACEGEFESKITTKDDSLLFTDSKKNTKISEDIFNDVVDDPHTL
jgi:hypothetical protein